MEVQVSMGAAQGVSQDLLRAAVELVLRDAGVEEGEISLALLDDQAIRRLNRDYLGIDRPTDVLAFALHEEGEEAAGEEGV